MDIKVFQKYHFYYSENKRRKRSLSSPASSGADTFQDFQHFFFCIVSSAPGNEIPTTSLWKLLCSFIHLTVREPFLIFHLNILYLNFTQFLIITPFTTINNNFQFVQPQLRSLFFSLICQQLSGKMISRNELNVLGIIKLYAYTHYTSIDRYQSWLQMGTDSSLKTSLRDFLTLLRSGVYQSERSTVLTKRQCFGQICLVEQRAAPTCPRGLEVSRQVRAPGNTKLIPRTVSVAKFQKFQVQQK